MSGRTEPFTLRGVITSMGIEKKGKEDKSGKLMYEGEPPSRNLLDYKDMTIEMSLWAHTNTGWMSVLVTVGIASCCILSLTVYVLLTGR